MSAASSKSWTTASFTEILPTTSQFVATVVCYEMFVKKWHKNNTVKSDKDLFCLQENHSNLLLNHR